MAKELTFQAKCSDSEFNNIHRLKAEIKLSKLPSKITDGEIVEQGLEALKEKLKKKGDI